MIMSLKLSGKNLNGVSLVNLLSIFIIYSVKESRFSYVRLGTLTRAFIT